MAILRKRDIAERLLAGTSRKHNVPSLAVAEDIVGEVYDIIIKEALHGNDISFAGFGKLRVKQYKGRRCRNIKTGQSMFVPPTMNVKFETEAGFKKQLNTIMNTGSQSGQ